MQDQEHDLYDADPSDDLGRLLPAVGQSWRRALGQRLSKHGLSDATALPILILWRARSAPMRQSVLAQKLGLESSGVVRLLDTLAKRGLLCRIEDPTDRRAKLLELTGDGLALGERTDRIARALRHELLADMAPEDVAATTRVIRKLATALETHEDKQKSR